MNIDSAIRRKELVKVSGVWHHVVGGKGKTPREAIQASRRILNIAIQSPQSRFWYNYMGVATIRGYDFHIWSGDEDPML